MSWKSACAPAALKQPILPELRRFSPPCINWRGSPSKSGASYRLGYRRLVPRARNRTCGLPLTRRLLLPSELTGREKSPGRRRGEDAIASAAARLRPAEIFYDRDVKEPMPASGIVRGGPQRPAPWRWATTSARRVRSLARIFGMLFRATFGPSAFPGGGTRARRRLFRFCQSGHRPAPRIGTPVSRRRERAQSAGQSIERLSGGARRDKN